MSSGAVLAISVLVNVVSAALYVFAVRERRRIENVRQRTGLDRPLNAAGVDNATERLRR